jgi:exocyst complex component 1
LLATCAISSADLDPLKAAPLETSSGIEQIETALVTLFRAMRKIDPALGVLEADKADDESSGNAAGFDSDYGKMRIVQEKKEMYNAASLSFMRRLVAFMSQRFDEAFRETKRAIDSVVTKKVDERNHDVAREMLWRYSPLVLYARDVDKDNWARIIAAYQDRGLPVYKSEFRDALEAWKRFARKPTGAEADLLFTSEQERQSQESAGNMVTAARKLTVKRSQTLARGLRGTLAEGLGGSKTSLDKTSGGSFPYEVFTGVLDDLLPLVEMEQNFIVDFFHATALEQMDFADAVAAARPADRRGGDLKRHRLMEPNRDMARSVTRAMEVIFRFLGDDLQGLVDWVCAQDPL